HPFLALKEIETGVVLPEEIHEHPVVRRLKSLTVRLPGWLNEFQSYEKDTSTGMGAMNLINVLANEYHISVADARERAFAIHDEELAEFVRLQAALPEFGEWHDRVANHIHHLSFVISGWRGVDRVIRRYDPEDLVDTGRLRDSATA
ncbi:MAG TPA: terpene synthase family protein, partial [Nitrospira sp.]|nr:terpene synthase family protein [Nitrospira sp.]